MQVKGSVWRVLKCFCGLSFAADNAMLGKLRRSQASGLAAMGLVAWHVDWKTGDHEV